MNGLTGGVGVFEGEPYDIEVGEIGEPTFTFNGYLDFADESTFIGSNVVRTALKKKKGNDWLNDVADAYTFRYLYDIGKVTNSDFIKVPYVINYIPDNMQLLMLSITTYMLTKELITLIQTTATGISEIIDSVTPNVGAGVTMDIGDVIWAVVSTVANIAYAIALTIALKNLIEQIIEQIFPKVRYHLGMSVKTMFQRAVEYLGFTLQSTLLEYYKDFVLIPSKSHKGGEPQSGFFELGCPTLNDATDKIGDLIRVFNKIFNADFLINGNIFIYERKSYFQQTSSYILPDIWDDQTLQVDVIRPNANEVVSNYNINWAYDVQDQNTLDNQTGRIFQVTLEPIIENDSNYRNLKGLTEIGIPFSMGTRKEGLTDVEKFLKEVAKLVDNIGGSSYVQKINDRTGMLNLSSHFITIPKMVVMQGNKLASNQRELLSAKNIYFNCHKTNSFAPVDGVHNQWYLVKNKRIPFKQENLQLIINNPFCTDFNGKKVKIERLKYKPYSNYAVIDFRINELFTVNLKNKYIE